MAEAVILLASDAGLRRNMGWLAGSVGGKCFFDRSKWPNLPEILGLSLSTPFHMEGELSRM